MTTTQIDNAIRACIHYQPRGITPGDVLAWGTDHGHRWQRPDVAARFAVLAGDGEICKTKRGWVAVKENWV
jgi:hypothetical protein